MLKFIVFINIIFALTVHSNETMSKHLKKAIAVNLHRKVLYSKLSNGGSEIISDTLIKGERQALLISWFFDFVSWPYRQLGFGIGRDEFISMENIPNFASKYNFSPEPESNYKKPDSNTIIKRLNIALKFGFKYFSKLTELELSRVKSPRAYHCIYRHFLESLIRTSNLADKYELQARKYNLSSPTWISKKLIKLQIKSIRKAIALDELAVPIQSKNIPILCNDVPNIPPI